MWLKNAVRNWMRRRRVDAELDEEVRGYVEMLADEKVNNGASAKQARREARMETGGVEQVKEGTREVRAGHFLETLWQDIRYGARMLRKSPGFTAVAVLTLALGIGANTALFSVVNGVLLDPLPYPHPNELVAIGETLPGFSDANVSYLNFIDWQRENRTFKDMAVYRADNFTLTGRGKAERVSAMRVSAELFSVFGVQPLLGRDLTAQDDHRGAAPVAMLSEAFWKTKLGGSPDILGKALTFDGVSYEVIGIVPQRFQFTDNYFAPSDVYVALGAWPNPGLYGDRANNQLLIYGVGRLKAGVTLAQARADMNALARALAATYANTNKDVGVALTPLKEHLVSNARPFLLILLASVIFVLLIACVNVANLLLARGMSRSREFAIRAALGARKGRVIRQLLTENLLLGVFGGGLGLLLAALGTRAALKVLPAALPRAESVQLDSRVLLFTVAISILAGVLFGFFPALKTSYPNLQKTLKEGGRGASGSRYSTQRIFVIAEVALAVILLIGAGLTIRSLTHLLAVDPGFDPRNVLLFGASLPTSTSRESADQVRADLQQLTDTVAAVPGVKAASITFGAVPLAGSDEIPFWVDGRAKPSKTSEMPQTMWYVVGSDYLRVMHTQLIRGRFLEAQDGSHSQRVGVIDETFAHEYFRDEDPIGKQLNFDFLNSVKIVGVVRHVKQWGLDTDAQGPVQAQLYMPVAQLPDRWMPQISQITVAVRTEAPNYPSAAEIQKAVQQMNSQQVTYGFQSMESIIASSLVSQRFAMALLTVFAAIALVLASIGIYGVMSYSVGHRTHELGIRLALGAQRRDVMALVLGQAVRMTLLAVGIGLVAAALLTRLMSSILYGVGATDPVSFAVVAVVLLVVSLVACYIPARKAMKVDPIIALRYE